MATVGNRTGPDARFRRPAADALDWRDLEQCGAEGPGWRPGAGLRWQVRQDLGENDRSATGYLPRAAFEAMADAFFAEPEVSVRGWERAADAQARIVAAVRAVIATTFPPGDIAIVSHGAVGALLLGHLSGRSIDRSLDQPAGNGGNFFAFDRETRRLRHGWMPIDSDIDPTF